MNLLFKNGYKIIFIKEGKFNLKQINISPFHISFIVGAIVLLTSSFFFIFSEQFVQWTGSREIEKHRNNNEILVKKIEDNQQRINNLLDQLEVIKAQDDKLRKLVKLPPIHKDIRKMGVGGVESNLELDKLNYLLPGDEIKLDELSKEIDYLNRLVNLESLSYSELLTKTEKDKDKILAYPATYPVTDEKAKLSSRFGYRRDPFSRKYKFHEGDDYSARTGTSVYATANGRIKKSRYSGSFGNYIEIDHGNGYTTSYGHLSRRNVKSGDKVYRGQKIGEVGNTGRSTAPHLHYEIQYNKISVDPAQFYFVDPVN